MLVPWLFPFTKASSSRFFLLDDERGLPAARCPADVLAFLGFVLMFVLHLGIIRPPSFRYVSEESDASRFYHLGGSLERAQVETSGPPPVDANASQGAKAKTKVKKVRATKNAAKADEAEAGLEAKEAEAAKAPAEAPAPAKGKDKGSAKGAAKGPPVKVEGTSSAPEHEQKEAATDPDETEQPEDVKEFLDSCDPNALDIGKETSDLVADGKSLQTRELIAAAVSGQSHVAWELLRSRADVNARDSYGRTALSAAFCSPDCDIHMWFLLHHAADQQRKTPNQRSEAQEGVGEEQTRTVHTPSHDQADIREDEFSRMPPDADTKAKIMADSSRADEYRTLRMLVTLLRGEGQIFTKMLDGFLKEVEPGHYRSERLKERMRTVLCDYGRDRQRAEDFVKDRKTQKSVFTMTDRAKKPEDVDECNLSWHNMLYAPEVQVSLRSLPIPAPLACEPSVLAALAETANEETLQTDAVEAITAAAWLQMRVETAMDNFLNFLALGCLCLVTWACRTGDMDAQPALWVLAMIQFKEAVELLSQLGFFCWGWLSSSSTNAQSEPPVDRVNGKDMTLLGDADISWVHPAPSPETLVDFFFVVAGYFAIYRQMDLCSDGELEPIFLPAFCSMYWLRLMYSLRGERWLGPYLLPILSAVRDTGAFFFVTSLCVGSATHAYVIMNPRGGDEYPIYSSFLHTVRLAIFGDFDLFEYQGQDTTFQQVEGEWAPNDPSPKDVGEDPDSPYRPYIYLQLCFFGTGIGITVLLMNLLIAILSQNYEMQQDRAQGLFVQARARMLLEVRRRPWIMVYMWLRRKLFDPGADQPPAPSWHLQMLAKIALSPLKLIMQPFVPGAYYQENIFKHFEKFIHRALWGPVTKHKFLALGIPVVCVVLLVGSLISLLVFAFIVLVLPAVGFRLTGIRYTLNHSLFGLFGDRFAEECEIFALVRAETGLDDLRSMRSDLKDLRHVIVVSKTWCVVVAAA
ncbi:unnamed protein product [Symbiodinium sp. CCMP2592]|nr:unnamed protein product [Symbiodinium sp. CCMP2592]